MCHARTKGTDPSNERDISSLSFWELADSEEKPELPPSNVICTGAPL